MCFELAKLVDTKWLASLTEESAQEPVKQYDFPEHIDFFAVAVEEFWDVAPEPVPVQAPVPARVQADVFVLTIETELYAVMYDKRERIQQHALSQV